MSDSSIHRERWERIDQLMQAALDQPAEYRAAFLSQSCAGDEDLRREVDSLLSHYGKAGSFLEESPADVAADVLAQGHPRLKEGQLIGRFKTIAVLGVGGMGEVYLAEDSSLGRHVALKLLPARFTEDPERVKRFEQEARAASALNHPNIVTIHEVGRIEETHFIVTEFIEGQTLRRRMAGAAIRFQEALDIAIQIASALGAAHAAGIVHRDIKPENIMVRPDGLIKILDLGLAKLVEPPASATIPVGADDSSGAGIQTEMGLVLGTSRYMSPEQARGQKVDARTDIFSLGVVLYEMVAGRAPFEGNTRSDVLAAILKEEPVPLTRYVPKVPTEIEWIEKKALAKDRDERYQTIRDLHLDLKRLKQELEIRPKLDGLTSARSFKEPEIADSSSPKAKQIESGGIPARPRLKLFRRVAFAAVIGLAVFAGMKLVPAAPILTATADLTIGVGDNTGSRFTPDKDSSTIFYGGLFNEEPLQTYRRFLSGSVGSTKFGPPGAGIQAISKTDVAFLLNCEISWGECHNGTLASIPINGNGNDDPTIKSKDNVWEADYSPNGIDFAIVVDNEADRTFRVEYPIGNVVYGPVAGWINNVRVSSEENIAFIEHPRRDDLSGYVRVIDKHGNVKVTSDEWTTAKGLAWSQNGDEVLYSAGQTRMLALQALTITGRKRTIYNNLGDIWLHDVSKTGRILAVGGDAGSQIIRVAGAAKPASLSWLDWSTAVDLSSDGKTLLLQEWGFAVNANRNIYLKQLDGKSQPKQIREGKPLALSHNGSWVLALQNRSNNSNALVRISTDSVDVIDFPRGPITEYVDAFWFPGDENILITGYVMGQRYLRSYRQDLKGGAPSPITAVGERAALVSPDEKLLVVRHPEDGKYYVHEYPYRDESPEPALLIGINSDEEPIRFTADGRSLYVRGPGHFTAKVDIYDIRTGTRKPFALIEPDPKGNIGMNSDPRSILIAPDGKSYIYTFWTARNKLYLVELK